MAKCMSTGMPVVRERPCWRTIATILSPASWSASSSKRHSSQAATHSRRNCSAPSAPSYSCCSGQPENFDMSHTKSTVATCAAKRPLRSNDS